MKPSKTNILKELNKQGYSGISLGLKLPLFISCVVLKCVAGKKLAIAVAECLKEHL